MSGNSSKPPIGTDLTRVHTYRSRKNDSHNVKSDRFNANAYVTVKEKTTATIFGVNVTIVLNPLPKGVVFERNGHRLGDTTLGNVTTPGVVVAAHAP